MAARLVVQFASVWAKMSFHGYLRAAPGDAADLQAVITGPEIPRCSKPLT